MFATTIAGGMCNGAPDVCKTPAPSGVVPVPYPNISQPNMATPGTFSTKVFMSGMNAMNLQSKIATSNGDQAGAAGGVASGIIMGETSFLMGSTKVFIEGKPAVHLTSTTGHNGTSANVPGIHCAPSQTVVMIMS